MSIDEVKDIIETIVDTTFEIERAQLPRSKFAGIRNTKKYVKRTNNLRNHAWKMKKLNDSTFQVSLDLAVAPYAKYINERNGYITKGYFERISVDMLSRVKNKLKQRFPGGE